MQVKGKMTPKEVFLICGDANSHTNVGGEFHT